MGTFGFEGLRLEEAPEEAVPVCPHCRQELQRIWYKTEGLGIIGQKQIVMCPGCRAFLGYGMSQA